MRHLLGWLLALLACSASGCVRLPCPRLPRPAAPLSGELRSALAYHLQAPAEMEDRMLGSYGTYYTDLVTLSLLLWEEHMTDTLTLECAIPYGTNKAPVVVILPVSGGGYAVERYFARRLARAGFAALIVHRERVQMLTTGEEMNALLRTAIIRNQRVLDWIETRAEFDRECIGVLGTSMGAIQGALLAGADSRVSAAMLGLGGGNLSHILTYSTEGAWRGGGISCRRETYLKEHGMKLAEFRRALEEAIVWNPARLASSVDPRRVRLILGFCDTVVPFRDGLQLRRAMGNPETDILPTGHYSAVLYLPWISREAVKFFKKRFAP